MKPKSKPDNNPFPGLQAFQNPDITGGEEDHRKYYFRDPEIYNDLQNILSITHFLAIMGTSGTGKSSLINCGLVPTLKKEETGFSDRPWHIISMTPGEDPIKTLAEKLSRMNGIQTLAAFDEMEENLRENPRGLLEFYEEFSNENKEGNLLIVVDQFEELFLELGDNDPALLGEIGEEVSDSEKRVKDAITFVNLLLAAHQERTFSDKRTLPVYVVISLQSDYVGEITEFPGLSEAIMGGKYVMPSLKESELVAALLGPFIQRDDSLKPDDFDPDMVKEFLNYYASLNSEPKDQLPLFQYKMMRTWDNWDSSGKIKPIGISHSEVIQGDTLSKDLDAIYENFGKEGKKESREQFICQKMFRALVRRGKGEVWVRRSLAISHIANVVGAGKADVKDIVKEFVKPHRAFLKSDPPLDESTDPKITISHDFILRKWDKLKNWLYYESLSEQNLNELIKYYRIHRASLQENMRPVYLEGPPLEILRQFQELNEPNADWAALKGVRTENYVAAIGFLEESKEREKSNRNRLDRDRKRQLQRAQLFNMVLAIAVLASVALLLLASIWGAKAIASELESRRSQAELAEASISAIQSSIQAQQAQRIADSARVEAENERIKAELLAASLQKKTDSLTSAEFSLRLKQDSLFFTLAEANLQRERAVANLERAQVSEKNANSLRKRSLAKGVAAISLRVDDPQKQGQLALKAFQLNQKFLCDDKAVKFNPYDPGIYYALYRSLQSLEHEDFNSVLIKRDLDPKQKGEDLHYGLVRGMTFMDEDPDFKQKTYRTLFSASGDGRVYAVPEPEEEGNITFDSTKGPFNKSTLLPAKLFKMMALSDNQRWIALAGEMPSLYLVSTKNPKGRPTKIDAHQGRTIYDLVPFSNDKYMGFLTAGADRKIEFHSLSGLSIPLLELNEEVVALAVNEDRNLLAGGTRNGTIYLWEFLNPNRLDLISVQRLVPDESSPITSLAFGPTNLIATGHENGDIQIWDIGSQTYFRRSDHASRITDIRFSPRFKFLASSSFDRTTRVWRLVDNSEEDGLLEIGAGDTYRSNDRYFPLILGGNEDLPWAMAHSFDLKEEYIFVGYRNGIVKRWPLIPQVWARRICGHLDNEELSAKDQARYIGEDFKFCEDGRALPSFCSPPPQP